MKDDSLKNGYRFSIRFNLNLPNHQKAWDKTNVIPAGKRSDYVVKAILAYDEPDTETLIKSLLSAVTDEIKAYIDKRLESVSFNDAKPDKKRRSKKNDETVSKDVLDFMKGL